jgi:hypothetical protein
VIAAQAMNLGRRLTQTARLFPNGPALIQEGGKTWSWGEMEQGVVAKRYWRSTRPSIGTTTPACAT